MNAGERSGPPPMGGAYTIIMQAVLSVAPERASDMTDLDGDIDFWEALDLDSIDHLAILEEVSAAIGADIPDRELPRLLTMNQLTRYVDDRSLDSHVDVRDAAAAPRGR